MGALLKLLLEGFIEAPKTLKQFEAFFFKKFSSKAQLPNTPTSLDQTIVIILESKPNEPHYAD